jgi:hypothetical protein
VPRGSKKGSGASIRIRSGRVAVEGGSSGREISNISA